MRGVPGNHILMRQQSQREPIEQQANEAAPPLEPGEKKGVFPERQASNEAGSSTVPSMVSEVMHSAGRQLNAATRAFMEARFRYDFSNVRLHTDAKAAASAGALNADAYTVGSQIVFNTGRFAPDTSPGKRLLAHELTHVVQQGECGDGGLVLSPDSQERYEQEADLVARTVVSGGSAGKILSATSFGRVERKIQRFESEEHRSLGNEASGTAMVNVGGLKPGTKFELQFGDVVALTGDYFEWWELELLAGIPGDHGKKAGTRDEIIYALYLIKQFDPRFWGGIWAFYPSGFSEEVRNAVQKRYQKLAATNTPHFAAPRGRDAAGKPLPGPEQSAGSKYRSLHESALRAAYQAGVTKGNISLAMAREAAAQHFLSDAFSAGHVRTPAGQIREYWGSLYPLFWYNLLHKMALDVATYINEKENNLATAAVSVQVIYEKIDKQMKKPEIASLPQLTLGDLVTKVFHDFDNEAGLSIGKDQMLFGDSHLDDPNPTNVTRRKAVQAMRAGIKDVEQAFRIGKSGTKFKNSGGLYVAVRKATHAPADNYVAESKLPKPTSDVAAQNWQAPNFESLWGKPMVGTTGPTVGSRFTAMLQAGQEIRMSLDDLAQQFPEVDDGDVHPRQAYLKGFVKPLVDKPKTEFLSIINWAPNYGLHSTDRDDVSLETGEELQKAGRLAGMTTKARVGYIRELIKGRVVSDEQELVISIFETAPASERPVIYKELEGHDWKGDWIHGVRVTNDDIWNGLNTERLARLKTLINQGTSGKH